MRGFPIPFRATPPPTETALLNAVTFSGTGSSVVGGSTPAVLADGSDATYTQSGSGQVFVHLGCGYDDLASHFGRAISSFVINVRCSTSTGSPTVQINTFSGVVPTGGTTNIPMGTSIADQQHGPYTKSGGGNWTVADINSMTHRIDVQSTGVKRFYEVSLTVTYV